MPLLLIQVLVLSIYFPTIICIYRFKNIDVTFIPLMILILMWCITDTTKVILYNHLDIAFVNNIHYIFESQLVVLQFYQWKMFKKVFYLLISVIFSLAWITEMLYISHTEFYRLTYF